MLRQPGGRVTGFQQQVHFGSREFLEGSRIVCARADTASHYISTVVL